VKFDYILLEYIQTFIFGLVFNPTLKCGASGRALVLGLGAGTMANVIHSRLESYVVEVFEISENVREAAQQHLGVPTNDERFVLHMKDALRAFEGAAHSQKYDLIVFDAYQPGPSMPASLVTQEYISLLASHLTPTGVFVLNFCLPFYDNAAQLEVMERFRNAFAHLHYLETTPTSKILIGYQFAKRAIEEVKEQHLSLVEGSCGWPSQTRGANYHVYLPATDWHQIWLRGLHQEASQYYCESRRLSKSYCQWFLPRNELRKLAPEAHFASYEQESALQEAKGNLEKAARILKRENRLKKQNSEN
jgi:hypothetical protein